MRSAFVASSALAALLVVACGDDSSAGTGGSGGGASATTTASSTSSTSSPSSATTAEATTVGGGEGGAGGDGAGGSGGASGAGGAGGGLVTACDEVAGEGAAITIVVVDETSAEIPVDRVVWQDEPADPFWLEPNAAICAGGAEPPCSRWEIVDAPGDRIVISSERETDAEPSKACLPYASRFVRVHEAPDGSRQLVHLTLPSDGTYCIGDGGRAEVNYPQFEELRGDDCLAIAPASGPISLAVGNLDGQPAPSTIATWYYPPKSEAFDGEHPLACTTLACDAWVVTDAPESGTIYLSVTYAGPLNPFFQQGWTDFAARPLMLELDERGEIVPVATSLALDTTLEAALGGDDPG